MDSRDIKEEPKQTNNKLEEIFSLQKDLIDGYIKIESLPQYPINIQSKSSQTLIKDFVGRVIEELSESYESLMEVDYIIQNTICSNGKLKNMSEEDSEKILSELQNASEEISDALHFFIELLIYTDISASDIYDYVKNHSSFELSENKLFEAMILGSRYLGSYNELSDNQPRIDLNNLPIFLFNKEIDWGLRQFGLTYSQELFNINLKCYFWDITHHLNLARNCLKNKPWKQSQMLTDSAKFRDYLIKSFILFLGTCYSMDLSSDNLYRNYFKKNKINLFRQKSHY